MIISCTTSVDLSGRAWLVELIQLHPDDDDEGESTERSCVIVRRTKDGHGRGLTDCVARIVPLDLFHACAQVAYLDDRLAEHLLGRVRERRDGARTTRTSMTMLLCFSSALLSFLRVSSSI